MAPEDIEVVAPRAEGCRLRTSGWRIAANMVVLGAAGHGELLAVASTSGLLCWKTGACVTYVTRYFTLHMDRHPQTDAASQSPTFYFPCPICGTSLDVRLSKKGRPYLTCDACGMQLFVRTDEGVRRFEKLVRTEDGRPASELIAIRPAAPPAPKRPRGRPRKNPAVAEAAARVNERPELGPLNVIGQRR